MKNLIECEGKIQFVSQYIEQVQKEIYEGGRFVFRGEPKIYPTSCLPNIFRNTNRNIYPNFEKNVLEKVRSEGLDNNQSYLLTAIEAQHGGFPSRLLDVTYNSLIALHFAVSPFYKFNIDKHDDVDGQVVIIKVENMYFPSSDQVEDFYRKDLLDSNSIYNKLPIFSNHFKMLDFYSKNERIRAQQGGFILFCGNEYRPLPEYITKKLVICAKAKPKIREELNYLFNISNAYVYPELNNMADPFVEATNNYSQVLKIEINNELNEIFFRIKNEFEYYLAKLESDILNRLNKEQIFSRITDIEILLRRYYIDLAMSKRLYCKEEKESSVKESISIFEKTLDQFVKEQSILINYMLLNIGLRMSNLNQIKGEYK